MLEITLLKTTHPSNERRNSGRVEARKLLSHIKNCDAFSTEEAYGIEENAKEKENVWASWLNPEVKRSQFLRGLRGLIKRENKLTDEVVIYESTMLAYLLRQRKPLVYVERWPNIDESNALKSLYKEGMSYWNGNREDKYHRSVQVTVLTDFMEAIKKVNKAIEKRDQHIAENLERVEQILRKTYPQFSSKEVIKLAIQIGADHRIEDYTRRPIKIIHIS
ncbi:hypothetical protein HYT24_00605 [Candidatus Pacearchaeota archaeon]|nr:hypothetical protein [Candidatus Pacearchaeota archaeon]